MSLLTKFVALVVWISLGSSECLADSRLDRVTEQLFERLSACELFEFTLPPELRMGFHIDLSEDLSLAQMKQINSELVWGSRFAKYFIPIPTTGRRQFEGSTSVLIEIMRELRLETIKLNELKIRVDQHLAELKRNRLMGECYLIESMEEPILPMRRWIEIGVPIQSQIDDLFSLKLSETNFSKIETELLKTERLTKEEIAELRAIRKATEIFERNSVLAHDRAGGFWTNILGEWFGGFQQNCSSESITYGSFLETLENRGLLRHFNSFGTVTKWPSMKKNWSKSGHVGVQILSRRTREIFVLDSWYEKGGTAAHILTFSDWMDLPVSHFRRLNFRDIVELPL